MTHPIRLVATPIGNLGDISHRALEALNTATLIACEDTRRTGSLLKHLGIGHRPFVVLNDHTERDVVERLLAAAQAGERVVVVSDAGMPAISDPGYVLVRAAIEAEVALEVVPGANAVLAALVLSGLATDRFAFDGFLPRKGSERTRRIAEVASERRTVVLYEAPHRLERTLVDLAAACGAERQVAVARELTKLYEQVWRGTVSDAVTWCREASPKGEIVVVVEGAPHTEAQPAEIEAELQRLLDGGMSVKSAAAEITERFGTKKREAYNLALQLAADS